MTAKENNEKERKGQKIRMNKQKNNSINNTCIIFVELSSTLQAPSPDKGKEHESITLAKTLIANYPIKYVVVCLENNTFSDLTNVFTFDDYDQSPTKRLNANYWKKNDVAKEN